MDEKVSSNSATIAGRPSEYTAEMIADVRRKLRDFWNHPESLRRSYMLTGSHAPVHVTRLTDDAHAHLEGLATEIEFVRRTPETLQLIGRWTVRDGKMINFERYVALLPSDDKLFIVTTATTITTPTEVLIDTHISIFATVHSK